MAVIILPGFGRSAAQFAIWRDLLPVEVQVFDLPGHKDEPPLPDPTLERLADHFADRIPPDTLIIGESLGGLIALALAARSYRVIAVDPPLSTSKLWTLRLNIPALVKQFPRQTWMPGFVDAMFGFQPDGVVVNRDYWPLLDALREPVGILAAEDPLWPVRVAETAPSVLDEDDAERLARLPNVIFRRVRGPHALLTESVEAARGAVLEMIEALGV